MVVSITFAGCAPATPPEAPPTPPTAPTTPGPAEQPPEAPPPGKSLLEAARIELDDSVELKAGETKVLDVTLETLEHGPGEVSYKIFRVAREYGEDEIPMPEGLKVSMEPTKFMAYPNAVYHSAITVETTPELAPGEYWLSFEAEFEGVFEMTGWIKVNVVP